SPQALDRPRRPVGERSADLRVERVVPPEDLSGLLRLAGVVELRSSAQSPRLGIGAHAEIERERRLPLQRLDGRDTAARGEHAGDDGPGNDQRDERDYQQDASSGAHTATLAACHEAVASLYNRKRCLLTASCSRP